MPAIDSSILRLRTDGLDWRELDDEIVVLDLAQSEYFAVNSTGALLWQAVAPGATRRDLIDLLVARFSVSEEIAAADVERFVEDLARRGLLTSASQ
jgi:Coenzyme PQQ synthesis protein D (PqqD)